MLLTYQNVFRLDDALRLVRHDHGCHDTVGIRILCLALVNRDLLHLGAIQHLEAIGAALNVLHHEAVDAGLVQNNMGLVA